MTEVREQEQPNGGRELTRAELEHFAGVTAQVLTLLKRVQDARGDAFHPGDLWTEGLTRITSEAFDRPEDTRRLHDSLPRAERRRLELEWARDGRAPIVRSREQVSAAATYAGQIYHLAIGVTLDWCLDLGGRQVRSRIEELAARIEGTAQELVLELGRILLEPGDHLSIGERDLAPSELRELERKASAAEGQALSLVH